MAAPSSGRPITAPIAVRRTPMSGMPNPPARACAVGARRRAAKTSDAVRMPGSIVLIEIILQCKRRPVFDIKITGGVVVDGTGRAPYTGDVAVQDGKIVEIGSCTGLARRMIDASGAHVLPGFVDIHTHYDGQVSWDPDLSPSSLLGVTTCVMGSCGVGFAPVRRGREQALVELMEGVEDIPGSALAEGIQWGWESFAEYM